MDDRIQTPPGGRTPGGAEENIWLQEQPQHTQSQVVVQEVNCVTRKRLHRKLGELWDAKCDIEPLVICDGVSRRSFMVLEIEVDR